MQYSGLTGRFSLCRPPRGGRGLKFCHRPTLPVNHQSPSSRRAWIEIYNLKEGWIQNDGRPPRGGRGLKSFSSRVSKQRV